MNKPSSRVVAVAKYLLLACAAAAILVMLFPKQILSPNAYLDFRACQKVLPGMSEAEVIVIMGEPRVRPSWSSNEQSYFYGWQNMDPGPVEVVFKDHGTGYRVDSTACNGAFRVWDYR